MSMSGNYKLLKTLVVLLGVVNYSTQQTIESLSRNFCEEERGIDNFSCNQFRIEEINCFNRELLCNGADDCSTGEDEGENSVLSSLQC